jgi:DNA modification methylase
MEYEKFLKSKVVVAENFGINTDNLELTEMLFPHQKDIVHFCLQGGRRAIFASFGLGKTFMQLEIAKQIIKETSKPFLIVCPLGVAGEFKRDNRKLNTGYDIDYITDTDSIIDPKLQIYLTNYERIRKGDVKAEFFGGVSFDEASILRNLQTETTNFVLKHFKKVKFRFVATATPTPNDFIEILNYADFLGVISRGHALTRFFQRDSKKAGNLKLYENKKDEFWKWVSTWASFINTPADLGYDDKGYNLPKLNIIEHCINYELNYQPLDKYGVPILFKDNSKSLLEVSREKRDSISARINKVSEIIDQYPNQKFIIWHHLENERQLLERNFKDTNYISVYGSLKNDVKEKNIIDFSENKYDYLLTKPEISGSGCNLQNTNNMIFAGINYKFNDFIQAIHRQYRFGQKKEVNVHIIYTSNEYEVMKTLKEKWAKHLELNKQMIELVKENGLNSELIKSQMERQIFKNGKKVQFNEGVKVYNNDTVIVHSDKKEMPDNSVDLYVTSIPFGDHYEYSDNYNDMGHNHGNENFFKQMDYLTPNMLRCLKPGRIAAIHVKDRIRYSYQNGTSFTTISDFSGQTVAHYQKHGFHLIGKITVTTDVVAENNQTYRLGWTEQCKDATKMGVGLPEYVLIFRKAPTNMDNAYSDNPVTKEKSEYTKALWQLDAHSYQRSSGDRLLTGDELKTMEVKKIVQKWKEINKSDIYDFKEHLRICEEMDELEKLSSTFMTLPVHSNSDYVWSDVNRMATLNANQTAKKKEKHICPLQFDIVDRLINRYSNKGDVICDPFGGLGTTVLRALKLGRKGISIELNTEYFNDSLYYLKAEIYKMNVPTLFDMINEN